MAFYSIKQFSSDNQLALCLMGGGLIAAFGFIYFGFPFGLVVLPSVLLGFGVYRIHVDRVRQKTVQITEASRLHLATVEALATAIDARDRIGPGHVQRTQIYAVGLGIALKRSEIEIDALRTGALLHDIGKLAVPDYILSKPGRLTSAELEKTKTHSAIGASILEKVNFPHAVVPTIKYHHEFWNGSGYPDGLVGNAIPITARILAVADAYDALRSPRPYRPAVSREDARRHIADGAGTQFDPLIAQTFLKNLGSFEAQIEAVGLAYPDKNDAANTENDITFVDQIKLANHEVFTLFELAKEFGAADNIQDTLAHFTRKIREFVPFDNCSVFLLEESRRYADAVYVDGNHSDILTGKRIRVGEGATGFVLKKREAIKNANPDLDFSVSQLELIQEFQTMASMPLIADNLLIGAVSIYSANLESYGDEHLRLLEAIARIAANSIGKLQQHAEAKAHALTDPMTGLPNARSLQAQFEKEVSRAGRTNDSFQVLMLDLDGFKTVNDSFGHKVGDQMLNEIGKVILGQLREYDFLARYGGDEFVALIPVATTDDVADLCSRIETAVGDFRLPVNGGHFASVGVSLGAAGYPCDGETFDLMVAAADKAMYRRKTGRKQVKTKIRYTPNTAHLSQFLSGNADGLDENETPNRKSSEGFIVELDETHVITSGAIN